MRTFDAARFRSRLIGILILAGVATCTSLEGQIQETSSESQQQKIAAPAYWPTREWRETSPEKQGLDSEVLANLVAQITQQRPGVHSLLVVRHGSVVLDAYFYPYRTGVLHDVASVTKSITSVLIGIAQAKGLLKTENPVLPFFPREKPKDADPKRERITIDDLLTMRPGLECGFRPGEQELGEMRRTPNWAQFALSLPMRSDPGTEYGYCSPGYHLLSSIISASAGQSEADFARRELFNPLGIENVIWPSDPQGRTHGWGNSHFYPREMAKIGYLYLYGGVWDGKQIVSKEWVSRSITTHARIRDGVEYGYGWWLYNEQQPREFAANGRGGQKISVFTEKDMIVVITGGGYDPSKITPLLYQSIKSDASLPENPAALKRLKSECEAATRAVKPSPSTPLPAIASSVSGVRYELPLNASRIESLSFTFQDQKEGQVKVKLLDDELTVPIGLDGVYRVSPTGPFRLPCGAFGRWISTNEFFLDLNLIANINHYTMDILFNGDQIDLTINEASGLVKDAKIAGKKVK